MREILFRGKREANGQWVFGSLIVWPDGDTEICRQMPDRKDEMGKVCVRSDTVGQYTGLTDKNGKKIFEGDIVRNGDYTMIVVWYDFHAAFMLAFRVDGEYFEAISNSHIYLEVIGNIHDNPELLGGGNDGK